MRAIIYNTIEEYKTANQLAHDTLKNFKNYNSKSYASDEPLEVVGGGFILFELPQFEKELKSVGFNFIEFNNSNIKIDVS